MMDSPSSSNTSALTLHRRASSKLKTPLRNDNWAIPEPEMPQFPSNFESIQNPREIYERMLLPTECDLIKDRRYHLRTYKKCFIASEMVDWFISQSGGVWSREQATRFGQLLRRIGCISHVVEEHDFADEFLFFKVNILRKKNSRIIDRPKEVILAQYTLEEVVLRIQDPDRGFVVKDRYFHLKKYEDVFVASEAVDWLVKNLHLRNRAEAVIWGRHIQSQGIIDHCVSEWPFLDQTLFFKFTSYFPVKSTLSDATVDIDISSSSSSEEEVNFLGGSASSSSSRRQSTGSELKERFTMSLPLSASEMAARQGEFNATYAEVLSKQKKGQVKTFRLPGIPAFLMRREYSFAGARLIGFGYVAAFFNRCGSIVVSNILDGRVIRINNSMPIRSITTSWPWVVTQHGNYHLQFYNVLLNRVSVFHNKMPIEGVLVESNGDSFSDLPSTSPRLAIIGQDMIVIHDIASITKTVPDGQQPTNPRVVLFDDLENFPENFKPSPGVCTMCSRYICIGNTSTIRVLSLRSGRQKVSVTAGITIPDVLSFTTATLARGKLVISSADKLIVYNIAAGRRGSPAVPTVTDAFFTTSVRIGDKFIETGNANGELQLRDTDGRLLLTGVVDGSQPLSSPSSGKSSPSDSPAPSPPTSPRASGGMRRSPASTSDNFTRSASIVDLMKTRINCIITTKAGWLCGHENSLISLWELQTVKENGSQKLACVALHKQQGPVRDFIMTHNTLFAMTFSGMVPGEGSKSRGSLRLLNVNDENDNNGARNKKKVSAVLDVAAMRL